MGFPGGSVVKNLPANARDMGSIPDSGRYHVPQQIRPFVTTISRARELQLLDSWVSIT